MKHTYQIATAGIVALALVSCKNPADDTTDATTTDSQSVAQAAKSATKYTFTDASTIEFVGSKVTGSHDGGFKSFDGFFTVDAEEQITGTFTIDMNSTWSDHPKLTEHLKADDFFGVAQYPSSTFEVTGFKKTSETTGDLSGNLTMRGKSKNITFPAKVILENDQVNISSTFDINRQDWGISFKGKPDDLIRDEVVLKLNLVAKK